MTLSLSDFGMRRTRSIGGVAVRVDEDEGQVLPVGEEPVQPVEQRVGLSGAGRPDEEGMEDHLLVVDSVGHGIRGLGCL